jgi:hypothetical protein
MRCIECGKDAARCVDRASSYGITGRAYHVCGACQEGTRRWACGRCRMVFIAKPRDRWCWYAPPPCPACGRHAKGAVAAVMMPMRFRGLARIARLWRATLDDLAVTAALEAERPEDRDLAAARAEIASFVSGCSGDYLGGHPGLPRGDEVIVGFNDHGIRAFSCETERLLLTMPWTSIVRIEHKHVPRKLAMDADSLRVSLWGVSGRGGRTAQAVDLAGFIAGAVDRDKHFVIVVMRSDDGCETKVVFESSEGAGFAAAVAAERLTYGSANPVTVDVGITPEDVAAKLRRLAVLRESGLLTADAFHERSFALLSGMWPRQRSGDSG